MEFIFECSHRYLTRSLRSLVRYRCEYSKINSISLSVHELFCLLYKHTNNVVFDDFPKISEQFPKIFQNCSEGLVNVSKNFPKSFRRLPKVTEDCRR